MNISPAVAALFQQLVDQIEAEVRQDFMAKLGGEGTPSTPYLVSKGRKVKGSLTSGLTKPKTKGAKRSPDELAQTKGKILTAVKRSPGLRVEELAVQLGLSTKDMALPMLQLRDERAIRKKGEKRAAKYFPR